MAGPMTRAEFDTPEGRKRAWRNLFLGDHGFLRKIYDNTHQISDKLWRSYQPSPARLAQWREMGVKTVINLRGLRRGEAQSGFYYLEEEACKKQGLTLVNFRAYSREAPSREFILGLNDLFDEIEYPAVLHCKSGADRAGIGSTLYLFLHEGKSLDEALDQLSFKYGHVKEGKTGVIDHFFDTYKAAAARDNVEPGKAHFLAWVEKEYDKQAVQESFEPTKLGSLLTEKILRRE